MEEISSRNVTPSAIGHNDKAIRDFALDVMDLLPYEPNDDQVTMIAAFAHFMLYGGAKAVFLLNGYAGTGKTSLTGAIVKALTRRGTKSVLLAPTGRAAQVFSDYSGHPAYTIHRKIYRQNSYLDQAFSMADNKHTDTLFIVDEASMISNSPGIDGAAFGTGRLLDDLVGYVYANSQSNCRLVLMGDSAQLPPVGQTDSPALKAQVLSAYGLSVYDIWLTQIARQAAQSGILYNATTVRRMLTTAEMAPPVIELRQFDDVETVTGEYLLEKISDSYDSYGPDDTIIITRSNRRAKLFNGAIRNQILFRDEELTHGDMLLVTKNNYHWAADYKEIDFIANGDVARVQRVWGEVELRYGLRFAQVTLEFPDHGGIEVDAKVILDSLFSDTPALTREQSDRLYNELMAEMTGDKHSRYRALKANPYFNALQVKFAYAVTCHKAQGGQWQNVFVDMGSIMPDALSTLDFMRWLYTAMTRARKHLYLINCPLEHK